MKDGNADAAVGINVWVVDWAEEFECWWFHRVVGFECHSALEGKLVSAMYMCWMRSDGGLVESRVLRSGNANLEIGAIVVAVFVDDHESDGPVHEVLSIAELYCC